MSFCFDFALPEDADTVLETGSGSQFELQIQAPEAKKDDVKATEDPPTKCKKCHRASSKVEDIVEVETFYDESVLHKLETRTLTFANHTLVIIDTSTIEKKISEDSTLQQLFDKSSSIFSAINSQSDLVAGSYEGGLKVWECGTDLAHYLTSSDWLNGEAISNKRIIELGCGAGLPGLCCLKLGAMRVDFQDYNEEVLKLLTYPNVKLTTSDMKEQPECHYFAGDWSSLSRTMANKDMKYDVILTAETIYNEESYPKLYSAFESLLTENGVIFVAAKSYYFGVGGSVDAFVDFVNKQREFATETVHSIKSGVHREILRLTRHTSSE